MKLTLTLMLSLAVLANLRAAGPDDQYLAIYSLIQQADSQTHDPKLAASQYMQAQNSLKKLQAVYPSWETNVIKFRLKYVADKLATAEQTSAKNAPAAPAAAAQAPAVNSSSTTPEQIARLNEQIQSLSSEKSILERKLKEALSIQPATVDPSEMAKAQQTITELKKERDLLSISLEQEKSRHPQVAANASNPQPQNGLASQQAKTIKGLIIERDALQEQIKGLAKTITRLKAQLSQNQTASAPKVEVNAEQAPGNPHHWYKFWSSRKKTAENISNEYDKADLAQVATLRARIAVLEAKSVPYTSEELAMIKLANARPIAETALPAPAQLAASATATANAVQTPDVVHSIKDLPAGAGALMAEAQRAYTEGDFATAESKFSEVLRQDDKNVYVLSRLASAQLSAGHAEACEKSVQQALAVDPNDAASLFLLGNLRIRQNKLDEALDALSRSAAINPTNAATENCLGGALNQKGLQGPAEAALRKALELDPNYPEAHHNLAIVYATEKPPFMELARWHYKKALDLGYPRNPQLEKILNAK